MSHFPLQLRTSASLDFASQRKMHFMPEPSDVNDDRAALDLLPAYLGPALPLLDHAGRL